MNTDELAARITRLENRVEELEGQLDAANDGPDGTLDRYDATVIERLERGETYSLGQLNSMYREAGVRKASTVKRRVKHLTKTYCERQGRQRWRFDGKTEGEE